MSRNNLYKLGFIAAVAAFSLFLAYPPEERINLGLDLRGGMRAVVAGSETLRARRGTRKTSGPSGRMSLYKVKPLCCL